MLLFSNVFIGLCAVAQGYVTYHLLELPPNKHVLGILFLGTLIIYNLSMLLAKPKKPQESGYRRVRWIFSHHRLTITTTLVSCLAIVPLTFFFLNFHSLLFILATGLLAAAYSFPLFMLNNKAIGLRNLPGIKLFLIALIWSLSTVAFPIIQAESEFGIYIPFTETFLLTAKRFLFIAAITIPFDIRDLFQDKIHELKTLPVLLGVKKSQWICFSFLSVYAAMLLLYNNGFGADVYALFTTILLTGWLIFKSDFKRNEYYYFLLLDGTMILQLVMLKIFNV